jgi:tetratricopeptide (TPR) repeat protein
VHVILVVQRSFAVAVLVLAVASHPVQAQPGAAAGRQTALGLEQQGQLALAEDAWRAVLSADPRDAEAYAHLGLLEAKQGHYQKAMPLYRKALALDPDKPAVQFDLGLSEFKGGELKSAIQTFSLLLKTAPEGSPERIRLMTLVGLSHYGLGEYAEAIPFLKTVTASDPRNLPYRLLLAQSCMWSKHYHCVLDTYHQILELNPDSAEAHMLAGEAYDEMKNEAGATEEFRAAVQANSKLPYAHFGLGYLLWGENKLQEAAQEFKAELANVPDEADAMVFLADCDMQMHQQAAAAPLLEKAIALNPRLARGHLDLGILYSQSGRQQDALQQLKLAAQLAPDDVNVHWHLARLYMAMGNREEAKVEFAMTKHLNEADQKTIFQELHAAQSRGKAPDGAPH